MYTKRLQILLFTLVFSATGFYATAQNPAAEQDSAAFSPDTTGMDEPLVVPLINIDTLPQTLVDSMLGRPATEPDTLHDAGVKQAVDAPVTYSADDSIVYSIQEQKVYLFSKGHIEYKTITLDAAYIEFNMGNEAVFATGVFDSLGKETGKPSYNFRTKKGIITDIFTEQEGGYLHSEITKRHPNGHIHMRRGKYTTCDAEHPHFYIALSKAKSIPHDKIISGPAYIVLEDVPLPIGIPFGFFPSNQINQSGFLLPTYGEEERRGFYLRGGGFYFALSQYFDLAVTGDIFTNGTWGVRTSSSYKKNYKFSGNFGLNYFENIVGEEGLENYQKTKDFDKELEKKGDAKQNQREKLVKDIRKMREEIELMNEKAREKKEQDIEAKIKVLQEFDQDAKAMLTKERDDMVRDILKEMSDVIQEYGQNNGYSIILNDRVLLYGNSALDISGEIIKILNNRYNKR